MCNDGDLRLRDGVCEREGRVEVCLDDRWGTICDDGWGSNEASVVCGQLNFSREGEVSMKGVMSPIRDDTLTPLLPLNV